MLIQAGFSHRPRGLQIILDHICQACLKLLKIFIGKQVTKRYYYSKEITLSEGILGSILWNSQLYVQIRIRDIIARLIGKQPLTVSTYIAKLCDHTQVLFELLPIYFIKILGNFGLNILRCKAVKLGQRTKSYAIEQHPKRHIPIHSQCQQLFFLISDHNALFHIDLQKIVPPG